MADLAELNIRVSTTGATAAATKLKGLEATAASVQQRVGRLSMQFKRLGRTLTRYVSVPLAAIGGGAVAASATMQDALAKASAQANITGKTLDKVAASSQHLAEVTGKSTTEIINGYKFAMSAGLDFAKSQDLIAAATKASAAGFGDIVSLERTTTTAMQAFNGQIKKGSTFLNDLVGTARVTELEVSKLAPAFLRNASTAQNLGISMQELFAAIGSVSEVAGSAQRGGRLLQQLMVGLLNPTGAAAKAIDSVYKSVDALHKSIRERGLLKTLQDLKAGLNANGKSLSDVFRSSRRLEGVYDLMANKGLRYNQILKGQANNQDAVNIAFSESLSFLQNLKIAWQSLLGALRPIGNMLIMKLQPALTGTISKLHELEKFLKSLPDSTKSTIAYFGLFASAVGPATLALGLFAGAISKIISVIGVAADALGGFELSLAAVSGVGAVFAGTAVLIYEKWDAIVQYFTSGQGAALWEQIKKSATGLYKSLKSIFTAITNALRALWSMFGSDILKIIQGAFEAILTIVNAVLKALKVAVDLFSGNWKQAWKDLGSAIEQTFKDTFGSNGSLVHILQGGVDVLDKIRPKFPGWVNKVLSVVSGGGLHGDKIAPQWKGSYGVYKKAATAPIKKAGSNVKDIAHLLDPFYWLTTLPKPNKWANKYQRKVSQAVQKIQDTLQSKLATIQRKTKYSAFLPNFDANKSKIQALRDALNSLLSQKSQGTKQAIAQVTAQYLKLQDAMLSHLHTVNSITSVPIASPVKPGPLQMAPNNNTMDALRSKIGSLQNKLGQLTIGSTAFNHTKKQLDTLRSKLQNITGATNSVNRATNRLRFTFTSSFEKAIVGGQKLSKVLNSLLKDLEKIAIQSAIQPIFKSLFQFASSGFSKSFGGLLKTNTVGDALITKDGKIIKGHPQDNVLFAKDMSKLAGGSTVNVNVHNSSNSDVQVTKKKSKNGVDIDMFIRNKMTQQFNSGHMDDVLTRTQQRLQGGY